jgi:hypothetical protein
MAEKKVVINLSVSVDARRRLEDLAKSTGWPLGAVLEKAILTYQLGAVAQSSAGSDWVKAHEENSFAIELLQHWQRDFEGRLSALESRRQPSLPQSLPLPTPEPEPAKIAVSVAVAAVPGAQSTDVSDTGLTASSSSETNPADNVLAALLATIPEAEFTGPNGERNRRIVELHQKGLGTTQISKALVNANIANNKENSVKYFLEKHGIKPNRVVK